MKFTFLGTGTSQGVPQIGCRCKVCNSTDERDKRLRTSAMVEVDGVCFVIDAGPDFRQQMLREGVSNVDAILLTHGHTDHIAGLDDVRAINYKDYPLIRRVPIYAMAETAKAVRKVFYYAFARNKYRGVPVYEMHTIENQPFETCGVEILPIVGRHSRFEVTGYRIGKLAYLTDFKEIDDDEVAKLEGVEVLVVNALRFEPHDSHFSVDEALLLIERIKPRQAYLTHMSHEVGLYEDISRKLPQGVNFAYDGLNFEL